MTKALDDIEGYIRGNIGFEEEEGSFEELQREFFGDIKKIKSFSALRATYRQYDKKFRKIKINKPDNCLKVGVVGELYILMEPFSNFFLEKELAKNSIAVSRFITVTYLLFDKRSQKRKY
jgi:predicted nucleotide-binding protein (sugar kinase/HSP70/actin superfamily)